MLKTILEKQLKIAAQAVLKKYHPRIVAITGSVGKTSAREAIACVLSTKFRVRQNLKNYNNEIGLPLSILDAELPGRSFIGWLVLFLRAYMLCLWKDNDYPEILVLEIGADHPGDVSYLASIAPPDVAVVTSVGQAHLENFGTEDNLAKEKGMLVRKLNPKGFAILNYDDERVRKMEKNTKERIFTYGFDDKADVKALELVFSFGKTPGERELAGLGYKLKVEGSFVPVHLPKSIGRPAVYASLAAASVGLAYGLNLVEISEGLSSCKPIAGRMSLVHGMGNTSIIDDTYNASPQSMQAAIETVGSIEVAGKAKRWAVLGDMLELGGFTVTGHQEIGRAVAANDFDRLVAVGERSLLIMSGAIDAGFPRENIFHFTDSIEAGEFLKAQIREGDLLVIKGSQGMRMERITKLLMAEPEKAPELLVRQDWADA